MQGAALPSARRSAAGILRHDGFYMLGGFGSAGSVRPDDVSADLWRFSEGNWTRLIADAGEPARYPSLTAFQGRLFRFGGCGWRDGQITFTNTVWELDDQAGRWRALAVADGSPTPAGRYTSAFVALPEGFFVFGGTSQAPDRTNFYYGDLWRFEPGSEAGRWTVLRDGGDGPGPLYGFGWACSETHLYLFGGYDGAADSSAFWSLDLLALRAGDVRWAQLPDGPPARYCPALGIVGGDVVVFGGRSKTNSKLNHDDTWCFDLQAEAWRRADGGGPGYHAKSAYGSDGTRLFVFGGEGPRGHVSDLWAFGRAGWSCLTPPSPDDPALW